MIADINTKIIAKSIGFLLTLEGVLMLLALPFSIAQHEPFLDYILLFYRGFDFWPIIISAFITLSTGGLLLLFFHKASHVVGKREGFIIVGFSWITISLFGALPYYLSDGTISFTDAFFESMSGFTTTGATIFQDVESIPNGILFWRALTHWIGGMGIIVFTIALLPFFGIGGISLFIAETTGPTFDKLHPRITAMAKRLWGIYVLLTVVETIALMLCEMSFLDAIVHAFSTVSTGGFSNWNDSVMGASPTIQYIIILFMILSSINFTLHYFALHGKFKKLINNEEFRWFIGIIFFLTIGISLYMFLFSYYPTFEESFRLTLFTISSTISTTGFVAVDYVGWPIFTGMIVLFISIIGGSAGSTSGGLKVIRFLLVVKNSTLEFKRILHPNAIIPLRYNGTSVQQSIVYNILSFFILYLFVLFTGTFILTATGLDFISAISGTATCLSNVGPGLGSIIGPTHTFVNTSDIAKWTLSFTMLLGRLELFTVLILFSKALWKVN